MSIKVIVSKAHLAQMQYNDTRKEIESIEREINRVNLDYIDDTINFVFLKGIYQHTERKIITACLLVNKTGKTLNEIHGVLRLRFNAQKAQIAKTTIDFDKDFIGEIKPNEALLVHLGIPVKGLNKDESFLISDINGKFDEVRITVVES